MAHPACFDSASAMVTKTSRTIRLFDAFSVLVWADIADLITKAGVPVQVCDRGSTFDRVKVISKRDLVDQMQVGQLRKV